MSELHVFQLDDAPGDTVIAHDIEDAWRVVEETTGCTRGFPDLLIGAASPPSCIVMVCPECSELWELGISVATRESVAAVLDLDEKKSS